MMKKYHFILFVLFILFVGCSSGDDKTILKQSNKKSILNDQIKALEKAKEVEQVIQLGIDKRIQAIDEEK